MSSWVLSIALPQGAHCEVALSSSGAVRTTGDTLVFQILEGNPRLRRLDRRPIYMHAASLGPYYSSYLAYLE